MQVLVIYCGHWTAAILRLNVVVLSNIAAEVVPMFFHETKGFYFELSICVRADLCEKALNRVLWLKCDVI